MLDFSKINIDNSDPKEAFEELVCQLAKRDIYRDNINNQFVRIHGSGGDGGVESYYQTELGKVAYQAKYFLKSGDIDWSQIKKSVNTAIKVHKDLKKYIIAIPCNLTNKTARGTNNGYNDWETSLKAWQKEANANNMDVEFILWDETEIISRISNENAQGLKSFFFGVNEFTHSIVKKKVEETIKALGERYNPIDHVKLEVQELIEGVVRSETFINKIESLKNIQIKKIGKFEMKCSNIALLLDKVRTLNYIKIPKAKDLYNEIPSEELVNACDEIRNLLYKARNLRDTTFTDYEKGKIKEEIDSLFEKLDALKNYISSSTINADKTKFLCVHGKAGIGKSHLLAHWAEQLISNKQIVIFFTGRDFKSIAPPLKSAIVSLYGIKNKNADEFFSELNIASEASAKRAVIIIDAINESNSPHFWQNELSKFQEYLKSFPFISCIISYRKEYSFYCPKDFLEKVTKESLQGFQSEEEQEEAAKIYCDKKGINRPLTPWLNEVFRNPLFLRSTTIVLQKTGKKEFPKGMHGTAQVFMFFIDSTARFLTENYANTDELLNPVMDSLGKISELMLKEENDYLNEKDITSIINDAFSSKTLPMNETWLEVLIRNGLLQKYPDFKKSEDPFYIPKNKIYFTFDRLKDYFLARTIVEKINTPIEIFQKFDFIFRNSWAGVMTELSVMVAEKYNIELIDLYRKNYKKFSFDDIEIATSFYESITQRKSEHITEVTKRYIRSLNRYDSEQFSSLALYIKLSLSKNHQLNAKNFLLPQLKNLPLSKRDACFAYAINENEEVRDNIFFLIGWLLSNAHLLDFDTSKLSSIIICFCLSSSDRTLRDKATKVLTIILLAHPKLLHFLLGEFKDIDDLYILERILASAYGSVCLLKDPLIIKEYAELIYNSIFADGTPPLNLWLRQYAKDIIEVANKYNLIDGLDISKTIPPYNSEKPILDIDKNELKVELKKSGNEHILFKCTSDMASDFYIYEIKSFCGSMWNIPLNKNITNVDWSKQKNYFDPSKLGLWIAQKVHQIGWSKKLFPNDTGSYNGRSRPIIETINKKYMWLAFNELQCRLVDNYYTRRDSAYRNIKQIEYGIDIDTTIFTNEFSNSSLAEKILGDNLILDDDCDDMLEWAFLKTLTDDIENIIFREENNKTYINLSEYKFNNQENDDNSSKQEFYFLTAILIEKSKKSLLLKSIQSKKINSMSDFTPNDFTNTDMFFSLLKNKKDFIGEYKGIRFIKLCRNCFLESHIDSSLEGGYSVLQPSSFLQENFNLTICKNRLDYSQNFDHESVFLFAQKYKNDCYGAFFDKNSIDVFLKENQYELVWIYLSERGYYGSNIRNKFSVQRIEGIIEYNNGKLKLEFWNENSSSKNPKGTAN